MKRLLLIGAAALLAAPAMAQYKVVGPDGRVTYTDRPPAQGQVSAVRRDGAVVPPTATAALPLELRQAVARFPVVLYTAPECGPCDNARRMLQQRGIPLAERQVLQNEDMAAVERITGGKALPAITIGAQALNGYSESRWNDLLDLAGYPRQSKLPKDYVAAAPSPVTPRPAAPPPADAPAPAPQPAPVPDVAPSPVPPIRF